MTNHQKFLDWYSRINHVKHLDGWQESAVMALALKAYKKGRAEVRALQSELDSNEKHIEQLNGSWTSKGCRYERRIAELEKAIEEALVAAGAHSTPLLIRVRQILHAALKGKGE